MGVPLTPASPEVPPERQHAEADVTVHASTASSYEDGPGPRLGEVRIDESFESVADGSSAGWSGESSVRALETRTADGRARLVTQQRFVGELAGRRGTFVLQGWAEVADGGIQATWAVVAGSGTDDLTGLRGEGGFAGRFGHGSRATLDFWFT